MKIPDRQAELDAFLREHLSAPEPNGDGHANRHHPLEASDEEVIALCRKAKNAPKFADLFDAGDTAAHNGDDSRADLALLGIFAFYTQDPAQLERLFSASALGRRPKWNRSDYRSRTISKALADLRETYTPPRDSARSRSRSLGDTGMRNDGNRDLKHSIQALSFSGREKPAPRSWIVDNHVWEGHATSWFGEGGVAK